MIEFGNQVMQCYEVCGNKLKFFIKSLITQSMIYSQDIENILATWLADNHSKKCSKGLKFIQFIKKIKVSPWC